MKLTLLCMAASVAAAADPAQAESEALNTLKMYFTYSIDKNQRSSTDYTTCGEKSCTSAIYNCCMAFNLKGAINDTRFDKNGTRCMMSFPFKPISLRNTTNVTFLGCSKWTNSTYNWPKVAMATVDEARKAKISSTSNTIWNALTGGNSSRPDKNVSTEDLLETVFKWGEQSLVGSSATMMKASMVSAAASLAVISSIY